MEWSIADRLRASEKEVDKLVLSDKSPFLAKKQVLIAI
jgi:hypothetical protein